MVWSGVELRLLLPQLSAEHVVYGGHLLLVAWWAALLYAMLSAQPANTHTAAAAATDKGEAHTTAASWSAVSQRDEEDSATPSLPHAEAGDVDTATLSAPVAAGLGLRWVYVVGYLLMMAGDWLQGPYVYDLYRSYGFSQADIARLFVAGFGSSAVLGSAVAGMADVWGAKRLTLLYAVLYVASCLTKHSHSYDVLLAGRLLGGVATSILFSALEAWLVTTVNHSKRQASYTRVGGEENGAHPPHSPQLSRAASAAQLSSHTWLATTFSQAAQGNSFVAIGAGLLGEAANAVGGPVAPFDAAIVFLTAGAAFVAYAWADDRTLRHDARSARSSPRAASRDDASVVWRVLVDGYASLLSTLRSWLTVCVVVARSPRLLCVCVIQTAFESSMYIFVFLWSPALQRPIDAAHADPLHADPAVPAKLYHGWVFASFMLCTWCGSFLFEYAVQRCAAQVERMGVVVMLLACTALACVSQVSELYPRLALLSLFELAVGLFWPYIAAMRERYIVDDDTRGTTMSLFRIPLNLIVVQALLSLQMYTEEALFQACAAALALAAALNVALAIAPHATRHA